jgi:hypothetical protein
MFPKFALADFDEIKCQLRWFKLIIDNKCSFDLFCEEIEKEGNLRTQLKRVMMLMEQFGNGLKLPQTKLKLIGRSNRINLFEIKTHDLRIYFIRDNTGAIVMLGGKKSTQKHDINRFRNLAIEYIKEKEI